MGQNPPDNASEDPREVGLYGKDWAEANVEQTVSLQAQTVIHTQLQLGDEEGRKLINRFNDFSGTN